MKLSATDILPVFELQEFHFGSESRDQLDSCCHGDYWKAFEGPWWRWVTDTVTGRWSRR